VTGVGQPIGNFLSGRVYLMIGAPTFSAGFIKAGRNIVVKIRWNVLF
jgi:hypothetical protein